MLARRAACPGGEVPRIVSFAYKDMSKLLCLSGQILQMDLGLRNETYEFAPDKFLWVYSEQVIQPPAGPAARIAAPEGLIEIEAVSAAT